MKTILKILLILLVMWPVYSRSQEPAPKQKQHEASITANKSDSDKRGTKDSPLFISVMQPKDEKEKTTREEKREEEKMLGDAFRDVGSYGA